jgi:hypothetical protein
MDGRPIGGGDPVELVKCASAESLSGGPTEFVFADCGWFKDGVPVRALNIATGATRLVGNLEGCPTGSSVAVRPYGGDILYVRSKNTGVDLFLIENFR